MECLTCEGTGRVCAGCQLAEFYCDCQFTEDCNGNSTFGYFDPEVCPDCDGSGIDPESD